MVLNVDFRNWFLFELIKERNYSYFRCEGMSIQTNWYEQFIIIFTNDDVIVTQVWRRNFRYFHRLTLPKTTRLYQILWHFHKKLTYDSWDDCHFKIMRWFSYTVSLKSYLFLNMHFVGKREYFTFSRNISKA